MISQCVSVIGLGGIGSWTAALLARIGCETLVLYDNDKVEVHNLANQEYSYGHVGLPKTRAVIINAKMQGLDLWHEEHGRQMEIIGRSNRVDGKSVLRGIVVVAVDNVDSRKEIFAGCKFNPGVPLYIEAGAAENRGVVRTFLPHDKDQVEVYENLLSTYGDGGPAPCVSEYMGPLFAAVIVSRIVSFNRGFSPLKLEETHIDFREKPEVETNPVVL